MAKQVWFYREWVESPRFANDPNGVLEPLLEGTKVERAQYTFYMFGWRWWAGWMSEPTIVHVRDPRLFIDNAKSEIFAQGDEVMAWLRENVRASVKVVINTSETRSGAWDVSQDDFAWVEFGDSGEAMMFKLVFG